MIMPSQSAASQAPDRDTGKWVRIPPRLDRGRSERSITPRGGLREFDFAGGKVGFRDMFVGLTAVPVVRERYRAVGYFREPFSLEGATSSRFITFMERSPMNTIDPARNWGAAAFWYPDEEWMTAVLGAFRNGTSSDGTSTGNGNAWAVTGRVTGLPLYDGDEDNFRLIHVGTAISLRQPLDGVVTYTPAPQNNLLSVSDNPASPLLPPVTVPAKSQQLYNVQAAAVSGPFSMQGEWYGSTVQQPGAGVVFFHGLYVYGKLFSDRGTPQLQPDFGRFLMAFRSSWPMTDVRRGAA